MTGKEAIIERIIDDARRKANSTSEEGAAKAQEMVSMAENDAKLFRQKNREESSKEREDIIRRRITAGNLAVKKLMLATKQALISRAFDESIAEIRASKQYPAYLKGLLKFAVDGDVVIVCKADKDILPQSYVAEYARINGMKLGYAEGNFAGGLILSGVGSDKNLTLEVEVASVRDEIEPQIAEMMFGE